MATCTALFSDLNPYAIAIIEGSLWQGSASLASSPFLLQVCAHFCVGEMQRAPTPQPPPQGAPESSKSADRKWGRTLTAGASAGFVLAVRLAHVLALVFV